MFVLRALLTGAFLILVGSCGQTQLSNGTPIVRVTATNSRFTTFVASIDSITLNRDDGNAFTLLGVSERADLTKVVDVSELLAAPAFPTGTYKSGTITVDLSLPIIYVDVNGQSVAAAPVDTTGAAVTAVTLSFNFDPSSPLVLGYQKGTHLGVEFDLAASTIVNTAASPLTVTFTPVVVVSTVVANNNPMLVHGAFLIADPGSNSLILNTLPFDVESNLGLVSSLGAVSVQVDSSTTYDLNGLVYQGSAGLAAAAKTSLNFPIAVVGTFTDTSKVTPVVHATQVYTGNTLEGPFIDHLQGYVTARNGNSLTVHGSLLTLRGGRYSFTNDATVTVGTSTFVNTDGSSVSSGTIADVSVGQQIEAIGQAAADSTTNAVSLDATAGEIRIQSTRVWGLLNSATPGSLLMGLTAIGPFQASAFDFTGTGGASGSDATPASYVVNTGTTDLSATAADTPVQADGIVTGFGSAPPDFTASAVSAPPASDSLLQVEWPAGTGKPFADYAVSGLHVDLTNSAMTGLHEIDTGPFTTDLLSLSASPLIVPDTVNGTNYSAGSGSSDTLSTFTTFSGFITEVTSELSNSKTMRKLVAVGHYDAASNTFTAKRINLVQE
jgi:hypothetical protein